MDRLVTVKFFRVVGAKRTKEPFIDRLNQINAIPEAARCHSIDSVPFWIDKMTSNGNDFAGRFCRRQSTNLPPRAPPEGGLLPLGIREIGQTAAWRYNSRFSVIGIEANRNGVTLSRMLSYIKGICDCGGYGFQPVTTASNLEQLRAGRIREFSVRVATPKNLESVSHEQTAVRSGMTNLMGADIATQVEIRYSSRAGDPDLPLSRIERIIRWLRHEKANDRGDISSIRARVIADGDSIPLDLLEEVHLQTQAELDLPDDDPDISYEIRRAFVNQAFSKSNGTLHTQFG